MGYWSRLRVKRSTELFTEDGPSGNWLQKLLQLAVQATEFMLPIEPVAKPTHWVSATQSSLTNALPLSQLQSPPERVKGRK